LYLISKGFSVHVKLDDALSQVFNRNLEASSLISRDTPSATLKVSENLRNFRRFDLIYLAVLIPFALGTSLKNRGE